MAWSIKGQYMESCNCDYLCPCIFTNPQGPATRDHCTAPPIAVGQEGLSRTVDIPGVLSFAIQGVEPRNSRGEAMHIDNTSHPANKRLALARAKQMQVTAFGVNETILGQGNNGHFAPFEWRG